MNKNKHQNTNVKIPHIIPILVLVGMFLAGLIITPLVQADRFDQQIKELQAENANHESQRQQLSVEAESLEAAMSALQTQISALETLIQENHAKNARLQREIKEAEIELAKQRDLLGKSIRIMYLEGDISTLEMLASSKNLSEFIDKQQYHSSVKKKIKITLDKVNALKEELHKQHTRLKALIRDQESMQRQLAAQRAEQSRLLSLNTQQRNALDSEIRENNERITELRRQQAIANARFLGTPGSGVACGGGYPGSAPGPWGPWGCNYPMDYSVDPWGMFNRQCVSYTAFRVAQSGRHMPYWGGHGNANQWDDNARAAGIPVNTTPRAGSIAISNVGFYGHAMYVEHVYDDGTILISQYNAGWDGKYSEARIHPAGLVFIHFP